MYLALTTAATRTETIVRIHDRRAAAESLFRARAADEIDHPGGTLLAHLKRVAALLTEWGADSDIQLAGLCHAAYGTDGFGAALLALEERTLLAETIGETAEALVYLYASCDREQTYPALRAFMEITAANELDVVRHNDELSRLHGAGLAKLFINAASHLSVSAGTAWAAHQTTAA